MSVYSAVPCEARSLLILPLDCRHTPRTANFGGTWILVPRCYSGAQKDTPNAMLGITLMSIILARCSASYQMCRLAWSLGVMMVADCADGRALDGSEKTVNEF
jgi:hypothetical protein